MSLAQLFKGLVLSQGYVTTPQRLREVAPEALPASSPGPAAEASSPARAARRACPFVPMVTVQLR